MCSRHHSRVYDDNHHKKKCNEENHDIEHDKIEDCKKEHRKREDHKKDNDDNHHKKRHKDKHHKKHHRKHHGDDLHKKKHRDEHHKKDHNEDEIESKQIRNDYLKNWLINFLKAYNGEYHNNFFIEKKRKTKEPNLFKEDTIKDKHHDGFKDLNEKDLLKTSQKNCRKHDRLKKSNNSVEEEEYLKESHNNIEEEEFLKESYDNIEEVDSLKESYNNMEEEDCLKESYNNIKEEDCLKESDNNIDEEDCLKEIHNNIEEEVTKETYKKPINEYKIMSCKTKVTSEMLPICENVPHISEVTAGPVTVRVPVVLTECTVTIAVESFLKLEEVISEIKHIRKNVYLNQCELVQSAEDCKANTGTLFLDGFINSDIEYATKVHNDEGVCCEKIKHVTVNVPFKCTTIAMFKTYPKFKQSTYQDETEILQTSIKVFDACGEDITGGDIREQSFKIIEFFNEKVFCELISAEIVETSILESPIDKECKTSLNQGFHDIAEKVVLLLTIKLLQNQHVEISKKNQE